MKLIHQELKLTVCVITYNQERYIRQTLDSILEQKTNFRFEILIGDDCSQDNTRLIIEEYLTKYPDIIRVIFHDKKINEGSNNFISVHNAALGQYVAHIDGDDVAFQNKLQKQVDALDNNADIGVVWHSMQVFNDRGEKSGITHARLADIINVNKITLKDLLRYGSLGATSSLMYRRPLSRFIKEFEGDLLDYYFSCGLLQQMNGMRINEVLGGYRVNNNIPTLSKAKRKYFTASMMKIRMAENIELFLKKFPEFRLDISLNVLLLFIVEIRYMRPSSINFFVLLIKSASLDTFIRFPGYLKKAIALRKKYI